MPFNNLEVFWFQNAFDLALLKFKILAATFFIYYLEERLHFTSSFDNVIAIVVYDHV